MLTTMDYQKSMQALKRLRVETGSLACFGCGHEHNCSTQGCAILRNAVGHMEAALERATLTPPNEWVSVEETKPEPGERVIATDGAFVGEGYMDCYGVWCRPNGMRWDMLDSEVTHWMPISEPPDRRPPEGEEDSNV